MASSGAPKGLEEELEDVEETSETSESQEEELEDEEETSETSETSESEEEPESQEELEEPEAAKASGTPGAQGELEEELEDVEDLQEPEKPKEPEEPVFKTPEPPECPNDDEQERRERRRSKILESVESLDSLGSPGCRGELWGPDRWTHEEIAEHYKTCLKLSVENKITTKNAFGLHLIDFLAEIPKENAEFTNFNLAAGLLEASGKIYAMRVDRLYEDTYKVLGNLSLQSAPAKDVKNPGEESGAIPKVRKDPPKKKKRFKTIVENLDTITVSKTARKRRVDPLFQRMLASYDECGGHGMFLRRMRTQNYQCELKFDSCIVPLSTSETVPQPSLDPVKVPGLKSMLLQSLERKHICSSLAGFKFRECDEEPNKESASAMPDKFQRSDLVFDPNVGMESEEGACAPPLPEDDFQSDSPGSAAAGGAEFLDDSCLGATSQDQSQRTVAISGDIQTMCQYLSTKPGEYSYFSPRTMATWVGPEHWHFISQQKPDESSRKKTKKKKTKETKKTVRRPRFRLKFKEKPDISYELCKVPRDMTTLERSEVETLFSSEDDSEALKDLYNKPHANVKENMRPSEVMYADGVVDAYNYNNPDDTANFCPALELSDSDDDNNDNDPALAEELEPSGIPREIPEETPSGAASEDAYGADYEAVGGELSLLEEPPKIPKVQIKYATREKIIDMERLKRTMWQTLTEGQVKGAEKDQEAPEMMGEMYLSEIIPEMRRRLPAAMAADLSMPIAFVVLLHVATDKNLDLQGKDDLSDVLVKQAK